MKKILPPLFFAIICVSILELLNANGILNTALIPAPHHILVTLMENKTDFLGATKETFSHVLFGFLLSVIFGNLFALFFSLSPILRNAILPYAIFFQTVPIIAIAPLLVIYFGFGSPTVIASSFLVSIFPILANSLIGLQSISIIKSELFEIYGANRWQKLWKLQVPNAAVFIFSGIKISAGLAVIGAVAGEFVSGGGLGAMIDSARTQQRIDIIFASIILLSIIGWLCVAGVVCLQKILLHYRPYIEHPK